MKHPPTRFCDDCEHYGFRGADVDGREDDIQVCRKGHKPRFYRPKLMFADQDWGYKRRCADYWGPTA